MRHVDSVRIERVRRIKVIEIEVGSNLPVYNYGKAQRYLDLTYTAYVLKQRARVVIKALSLPSINKLRIEVIAVEPHIFQREGVGLQGAQVEADRRHISVAASLFKEQRTRLRAGYQPDRFFHDVLVKPPVEVVLQPGLH
jgi:hypothetical protein